MSEALKEWFLLKASVQERDHKMSEKVVLPKFDLPGDRPHPALRMLWIVGGLLGVSILALGGAMWRHHALETAAEARAQAAVAARAAEAAAAIEAARVRATAAAEAKAAAAAAAKLAVADKADEAAAADDVVLASAAGAGADAASRPSRGHHSNRHHTASKSRALAKTTSADDKRSVRKSTRDDGAIDRLLSQFK
jgi:hypothetical protein